MKRPTVLAVDDRPENLLTIESLLQGLDLDLVLADSGQEALAKTLDHEFALILLDVQMPDMDGYETAELLRGNARTRDIPIIFISAARKEREHIFKGYSSGAVDYLCKPLEPQVLLGKVNIFLKLYRQTEQLKATNRELDAKLVELEELQQKLEESNEQLRLLSTTDGLTGLLNRRRFDEVLGEEWLRAQRLQRPLSLLIADIDHFKKYNDHYGHIRGDQSLRLVAQALSDSTKRCIDKVARFGGEEFAIILPETDMDGAKEVARRMQQAVEALAIRHSDSPTAEFLTISAGISTIVPRADQTPIILLETADKALYEAKTAGRNHFRSKDVPPQALS